MPRRTIYIYLGLSLLLAAVVAGAIALSPSGEETSLPRPLLGVAPAPGTADILQAPIRIDIEVGYRIALIVDGQPVPPGELEFIEGVGRFDWDRDSSAAFSPWTPGTHTVEVSWDRAAGLPDQGSFTWNFRIQ